MTMFFMIVLSLAQACHLLTCRQLHLALMVLLCIGDPAGRMIVEEKIRILGIELLTFVRPSAVIANSAQI